MGHCQALRTDCIFRCWLLLRCISVKGCISKACLYATWLMGVSAVIKGGQLVACCNCLCCAAHWLHQCPVASCLWFWFCFPLASHDISLPVLAVCVHSGFLYSFLCVYMLVCRLGHGLHKVLWSLVVAAFLACACPFLLLVLSGISMGL